MIDQDQALLHLSKDQVLKPLIERFGKLNYQPEENIFDSLVETIVNQQLSGKAASTIFSRFKSLFPHGQFTPDLILRTSVADLRSSGLSGQKTRYVQDLAEKTISGILDLSHLDQFSDAEIISHLTQVKGIGQWSAEMTLMFSLHRPDILPLDDLGIRNAFVKFYAVKPEDRSKMTKIASKWQPHRTVACWYLWKGLDNR
jgi:DNA-3-methyladenine glycosylase II